MYPSGICSQNLLLIGVYGVKVCGFPGSASRLYAGAHSGCSSWSDAWMASCRRGISTTGTVRPQLSKAWPFIRSVNNALCYPLISCCSYRPVLLWACHGTCLLLSSCCGCDVPLHCTLTVSIAPMIFKFAVQMYSKLAIWQVECSRCATVGSPTLTASI